MKIKKVIDQTELLLYYNFLLSHTFLTLEKALDSRKLPGLLDMRMKKTENLGERCIEKALFEAKLHR